MIIIYDKANTLTLPYDDNGRVRYIKFVPGKNEVASEVWESVKEYNTVRMEHYARYLKPLNEQAAGDDGIKYDELSAAEVQELIENTMEISELEEIRSNENKRDKPRKSVLNAIDKQVKAINDVVERIEAGE